MVATHGIDRTIMQAEASCCVALFDHRNFKKSGDIIQNGKNEKHNEGE